MLLDVTTKDEASVLAARAGHVYVVGYRTSPHAQDYRDFLERNSVPYQWVDVEQDPLARFLGAPSDVEGVRLPVFIFADGTSLQPVDDPDEHAAFERTRAELAVRVGLHARPDLDLYDVVVLGAGPAGLTAALYAASEGLTTAVVEKHAPGGQAGTSSRIENYPGFPNGLSGQDLAEAAYEQAVRFGAEIVVGSDTVTGHLVEDGSIAVELVNGSVVRGRVAIGATGFHYRPLDAEGVNEFVGAGVYYGASPSDVVYHRGGDVFVVGGANSAGQAALHLAAHARSVTLLVRGDSIEEDMSQYLVDRCCNDGAITVRTNTRVVRACGDERLERIVIETDGEELELPADALFILIGGMPSTTNCPWGLARDKHGFVLTGPDLGPAWKLDREPFFLESSQPGFFFAGDARHGSVKRVAAAVGEGAMAVQHVHRYLADLEERAA
jgi:thioredoxin reductase (NADPH)